MADANVHGRQRQIAGDVARVVLTLLLLTLLRRLLALESRGALDPRSDPLLALSTCERGGMDVVGVGGWNGMERGGWGGMGWRG